MIVFSLYALSQMVFLTHVPNFIGGYFLLWHKGRAARVLQVVAGRKFFSSSGCCGTRFAQTVLAKDAGKTEKFKRSLKGHNLKHPGGPIY